jgi:hypothetical protein
MVGHAGIVAGWEAMKKPKFTPSAPKPTLQRSGPGRPYANPLDYDYPSESMAEFSILLNLRHDSNRQRQSAVTACRERAPISRMMLERSLGF